jgi:hypothetical protein
MKLTALQVRVYYITCEVKVQELMFTGGHWVLGMTLGDVMPGSLNLYAAVRTDRTTGTLIQSGVGYQTPTNPQTITESYYDYPAGTWKVRAYP